MNALFFIPRILLLLLFLCADHATAQNIKIIPQTGHSSRFLMRISPDDKNMVTAGEDGKIMLWDIQNAKARASFHTGLPIYTLSWNGNNRQFATSSYDSVIYVWNAVHRESAKKIKAGMMITALDYNKKYEVIAAGDDKGRIKIFDAATGVALLEINHGAYITGLHFSSNGALLFAAGYTNGVRAYELKAGKAMLEIPIVKERKLLGMQVSENDAALLMHMDDGTTEIMDVFEGKSIGSFSASQVQRGYSQEYFYPVLMGNGEFIFYAENALELIFGNIKTKAVQVYNNTFNRGMPVDAVGSHKDNFLVMSTQGGGMAIVYFTAKDFEAGKPIFWKSLQFTPEQIYRVDFLQNDEVLALRGQGYYHFNLRTGDMHRRDDDSAKLAEDDYHVRYFIAGDQPEDEYYMVNFVTGTGYSFKGDKNVPLKGMAYSADTNIIAVFDNGFRFIVRDLQKKKNLVSEAVPLKSDRVLFNGIINDQFIYEEFGQLHFYNYKSGKARTFEIPTAGHILNLAANKAHTIMYGLDNHGKLLSWDCETGKLKPLTGDLSNATASLICLNPDGKILVLESEGTIKVYDGKSQKHLYTRKENTPYHFGININEKGTMIAAINADHVVDLHPVALNKEPVSVMTTPHDGLVVYTHENYYMSTRNAAHGLVLLKDENPVSFSNVDLLFNRPDKVLQELGTADANLLRAYAFAYEKRAKKAGIKAQTNFSEAPVINIVNRNEIDYISEKVKIKINASDRQSNISRIKVWQNDVPVFGSSGIDVSSINSKQVAKEIEIILASGNNKIKFSAVNADGVESDKTDITLVNKNIVKPDLFLVTIGTSEYSDKRFNLTYAAKDARDVAEIFSGKKSEAYQNVFVKTLTDKEVTKENIDRLKEFLSKAQPNDVVLVFVAGHGVRDSDVNYYYGTHDMDFNDPAKRGYSEAAFAALMDGVPAIHKLLFFDTCLSGEVDKDEVEQTMAMNTSEGKVSFRNAGAGLRPKAMGINNASALMREIYADLEEGTGSTIISSAGGAEFAMESADWKNGLFTYSFLSALNDMSADINKDGKITVSEIQEHVRKQVVKLSNGKQQPSFKSENMLMDFRVW